MLKVIFVTAVPDTAFSTSIQLPLFICVTLSFVELVNSAPVNNSNLIPVQVTAPVQFVVTLLLFVIQPVYVSIPIAIFPSWI